MNWKFVGLVAVPLLIAACASQPREPSTKVAVAPPSAVAAPASAAAALSGAPGTTASGQPPAVNRALIAAGYKPTAVKGEVYYCRMEDVTNTAFKRKVCLNQAQLQAEERKVKELQDRMIRQQFSPACSPFPACAD